MEERTLTRRGPLIVALITVFSVLAWIQLGGSSDAAPAASLAPASDVMLQTDDLPPLFFAGSYFAKYDAIDGESQDADHDKWIDILSIDWGVHRPGGGATGQSRRRGAAVVEDMTISMRYEKASPKLLEASLTGKVIPLVELELTTTYGESRVTYLKYELKNVMITSYQVNASGNDEAGPPTVVVGNNFEEIKVTYTEFDDTGNSQGNVEVEWKVEKGKK